jgi:hypothetical protein
MGARSRQMGQKQLERTGRADNSVGGTRCLARESQARWQAFERAFRRSRSAWFAALTVRVRPSLECIRKHLRKQPPVRTLIAAYNVRASWVRLRQLRRAEMPQISPRCRKAAFQKVERKCGVKDRDCPVRWHISRRAMGATHASSAVNSERRSYSSAAYVKHVLVTPRNVDSIYLHEA